jgi:gag-polyprotein putative aspartyl protease
LPQEQGSGGRQALGLGLHRPKGRVTYTEEQIKLAGSTITRARRNKPGSSLIVVEGEIHIEGKKKKLHALIDCGAEANFLSDKTTKELGIQIAKGEGPRFQTLNGQDLAVLGQAEVVYTIKDSLGKNQGGKGTFTIGEIEGFDMVLGMPWLEEWNPLPNFQQKTIRFKKGGRKFKKVAIESAEQFAATARDTGNICFMLFATKDIRNDTKRVAIPREYQG